MISLMPPFSQRSISCRRPKVPILDGPYLVPRFHDNRKVREYANFDPYEEDGYPLEMRLAVARYWQQEVPKLLDDSSLWVKCRVYSFHDDISTDVRSSFNSMFNNEDDLGVHVAGNCTHVYSCKPQKLAWLFFRMPYWWQPVA